MNQSVTSIIITMANSGVKTNAMHNNRYLYNLPGNLLLLSTSVKHWDEVKLPRRTHLRSHVGAYNLGCKREMVLLLISATQSGLCLHRLCRHHDPISDESNFPRYEMCEDTTGEIK